MCMCVSVLFGCIRGIEVARIFPGGGGLPLAKLGRCGSANRYPLQ